MGVRRIMAGPRGSSLARCWMSARSLFVLGLCVALQCLPRASARRGSPRQELPVPQVGGGAPAPANPGNPAPGPSIHAPGPGIPAPGPGIPAPSPGLPPPGPGGAHLAKASVAEQAKEMKALLQFAAALNSHPAFTTPSPAGSPWLNNTGLKALPCAVKWAWIRCSKSRVISINMNTLELNQANSSWGSSGNLPLTGSIAWESLAQLQQLQTLILSGNAVGGTLVGVGLLPSLTQLWLNSNQIQGIIPDTGPRQALGSAQHAAQATSSVPQTEPPSGVDAGSILAPSLGAPVYLAATPQGVGASAMVYEQRLPSDVALTSPVSGNSRGVALSDAELEAVSAKSARIAAAERADKSLIPGLPPTLVSLNLDANNLTGSLPRVLSVLTGLTRLNVAVNGLAGPFPAHLSPLTSLGFLDLHTNNFSGALPHSWSALTQLTQLNLADTQVLLPGPSAESPAPALLPAAAPAPLAPSPGMGPVGPAAAPSLYPTPIGSNGSMVQAASPSSGTPLPAPAAPGRNRAEAERSLKAKVGPAAAPVPAPGPGPEQRAGAPGPSAGAWPTTGVPMSWSNMVSLKHLSLSSCSMPGRYPLALTMLPAIEDISVDANQLYGALPAGLWAPARLVGLNLSSNYFEGAVPNPSPSTASNLAFHFDASLNCFIPDSAGTAQRSAADCDAFYASLDMPPSPPPYPAPAPSAPPALGLSSALSTGAIVAIAASLALLLLLCAVAGLLIVRRRKASEFGSIRPSRLNGRGDSGSSKLGAMGSGGEHAAGAAGAASGIAFGGASGRGMDNSTQGSFSGPLGAASHRSMVIERQGAREYSLWELEEATDNFSPANLVGKGGFGEVYYGELKGGGEDVSREGGGAGFTKVAVKRQKMAGWGSAGPDESFRNEIRILSGAYHRNLVALRGYCWEDDQLLLVFDFVPRGSLQQLLHGGFGGLDGADKAGVAPAKSGSSATASSGEKEGSGSGAGTGSVGLATGDRDSGGSRRGALQGSPKELWAQKGLSWQERVQLAVGAAKGINFLHNGALQPILHLDIKSGNILVDEQYIAKVSDFGLSTFFGDASDDAVGAEDYAAMPGWQDAVPGAEHLDGASVGATGGTHDEGASRKVTLGFSRLKTRVRGTAGYIDPERGAGSFVGQLSEKSDVYSFGVVLLELATGWKPMQRVDGEGPKVHIVMRVLATVNAHGMPRLLELFNQGIKECATSDAKDLGGGGTMGAPAAGVTPLSLYSRFVCLAMWCCVFLSSRRPTMRQVLRVLASIEEGSEEWGEERAILYNEKFREEDFRRG